MRQGKRPRPTYSLEEIRWIAIHEPWRVDIKKLALKGAARLGYDADDIRECLIGLTDADFDHSMESTSIVGTWQDVYLPQLDDDVIYMKVRLCDSGAVVIQFKLDGGL